jgi:hypothetical protein
MFKLDTFMEVNRRKVGKQHYFLKIGGDNVHAQQYLQYINTLVMLDKPLHSFCHARQVLHVAISGVQLLAKDLKSSSKEDTWDDIDGMDDVIDNTNDNAEKASEYEDNTPTESVTPNAE